MDLVTLIAACALTVEPKVMHALIWEQSGANRGRSQCRGRACLACFRRYRTRSAKRGQRAPTAIASELA